MDDQTQTETQASAEEPRSKAGEIILSGRISSAVWYLAWPTIINTFIYTAYNIINRMFLGRLEDGATAAQAALGPGSMPLWIQSAVTFGLSAGSAALIARFLGAKEFEDAEEAARQALLLSVLIAAVTMVPMILFSVPIVKLIGAKGDVVPLAADYLWINAAFSIPMFLSFTVTSVLRSAGDVRAPLYAGATIVGFNILLDWLLIFGVGPFPAMGIRGAALATGLSRVFGVTLLLWFLHRSVLGKALAHFRPHLSFTTRIMKIGWPAIIQNLLWTSGFSAYFRILSELPNATDAQAAMTVAIAIEMLCFMPGMAYSMAAGPMVGQNLGAKQLKRAERSAWVATGHAVAIMTLVAIVLVVFPRQLAMLFTQDARVIKLIVSYLVINAFAEPLLAVGMVLAGALQGAGDTRMPTWIEFIINWVTRLPLAWLLAIKLDFGAVGLWWALSSTTMLYGVLTALWFQRGHWRTIKV